jgi:serine protease Do
MSGMAWIFVGLLIFFIGAAAFTAVVTPLRRHTPIVVRTAPPRSWVGVNEFDTTDGGVTFEHVDLVGGPADKAGLVGGDIITTWDGITVTDDDQMMELLTQTPIGKTVDVTYIRDGETKTTKLTTISKEEFDRISRAFEKRPEGRAQFGYEDGNAERVEIPGTKIHGVKLNEILRSRPADLAGVKEGDVVIQFDDVPIRTPGEFLIRVRAALPYSTVKLTVMRGDEKIVIPVKMGKQ